MSLEHLPSGDKMAFLNKAEWAFSQKQRRALRDDRDGHMCQAVQIIPHKCKPKDLHVHHIIPQRYSQELGIDPDFPENALTICSNAHKEIHPDMKKAGVIYHSDNHSFHRMFQEREEKLKNKTIYWRDTWDRQLHTKAVLRTQKSIKKGWVFPEKKH